MEPNYDVILNVYANSVDALVPEFWARESLAILEENMVIGNLVHRDFSNEIASFGDTVNTRKPAEFSAKRKTVNDNVTIQDASATNIAVPLNQLVHVSFLIRDGEESKSFLDLVSWYLTPAMIAQARFVDRVLSGQYWNFLVNGEGGLDTLTSANVRDRILDLRKTHNVNKAPESGRSMIWTPTAETEALKYDGFVSAEKVGDGGLALREASMGRVLGFDHFMAQNTPSVATGPDVAATAAINLAAGYARGTTVMAVDSGTGAIAANTWIKIAGDDTPLRVVSSVGGATPTSVTVAAPGLRNAVADNAVVTCYGGAVVNLAAGYASGYDGYIAFDGNTLAPQVGQLCTFHTSPTSPVYTIIEVTGSTILLDRPLEAALVDDQVINLGPPGEYCLSFHRNALALVIRPLAVPMGGTGALASVVNHNGFSMRATITYDGTKQGHLVTLDMLMGVKALDTDLGMIMYG